MSLQGYEVFDIAPHFASPPKLRGGMIVDKIGNAAAAQIVSYRGKHPLHSLYFEFLFTDEAAVREFEDFFAAHAGKWKPFWIPSWHQELVPAADLASGSNQLSIEPVGYEDRYLVDTANVTRLGNYVFLLHEDGTLWTPRVTAVTGTDPEVLTLDANAAMDWDAGKYILGFLYFVRFMSDELEVKWSGPSVAQSSISFQEVVRIAAEADAYGDPEIEGIAFYDEFESYAVGQTTNLNRGYAWLTAWDTSQHAADCVRVMYDGFQDYTASSSVNGTTALGEGQSGAWFGW